MPLPTRPPAAGVTPEPVMEIKIDTRPDPPRRREDAFQATRWSLVAALKNAAPADAQRSLVELCQGYWYPIYAYIRRCGHAPEIAYDIAQAFFSRLVGEIRAADPRTHGRFRTFLLARLNRFLAEDWRSERVIESDLVRAPDDLDALEQRHQREQFPDATPELAFQRGFALEVLGRSVRRLRREADEGGRLDMFEKLEPYLATDPQPGQYEELGVALRTRPLALVMAIKRLRSRFRELVEEELAETVASPEHLDAERGALLEILGKAR